MEDDPVMPKKEARYYKILSFFTFCPPPSQESRSKFCRPWKKLK